MGSSENRLRNKWQDYSGAKAGVAELSVYDVFNSIFVDTEYKIILHPKDFDKIYLNVFLSEEEEKVIYQPNETIKKHGIIPDCAIINTESGKTIYIEIKRQDGWVEGKKRAAGRGNAHERLCKYFTPGILRTVRSSSKISSPHLPFWIIFQGDITRDPCRVREIRHWFDGNNSNVFFWRDTRNSKDLVEHFIKHIAPLLK